MKKKKEKKEKKKKKKKRKIFMQENLKKNVNGMIKN